MGSINKTLNITNKSFRLYLSRSINMKYRSALIMLIIVTLILSLLSTPAMALNKSELLSYYQLHSDANQNTLLVNNLISNPIVVPTRPSPTSILISSRISEPIPTQVIPIPPSSEYSYNHSTFTLKIQSILHPNAHITTPTFDSTTLR